MRVIQWATGSVGKAAIEGILLHPDLELVGCWVHSSSKDGVDVGEILGIEPLGDGVHLLAPGPERPPLPLRPPPQRPVERVAVGVGEAGEGEAG